MYHMKIIYVCIAMLLLLIYTSNMQTPHVIRP